MSPGLTKQEARRRIANFIRRREPIRTVATHLLWAADADANEMLLSLGSHQEGLTDTEVPHPIHQDLVH